MYKKNVKNKKNVCGFLLLRFVSKIVLYSRSKTSRASCKIIVRLVTYNLQY